MAYKQIDPSLIEEHGIAVSYRRGCRCDLCKRANTLTHLIYYHQNLDQERTRQREYERAKAKIPARSAKVKTRMRAWCLQDRYGMTVEDWDALIVAQSGRCAVCDVQLAGVSGASSPCVDHDHATGRVRAILCRNCNVAIGLLEDDPNRAMALAAYLISFTDVLEFS